MINQNNALNTQIEIVQISMYCDIIKNILIKHRSLSVIKILTFSFIIKKNKCLRLDCFSAKNKNDLVLKCLSQIAGRYDEFKEQLKFIFSALDILIKNNICSLHITEVICNIPEILDIEDYGTFMSSAIEEGKQYTDRQFLREVISIV